MKKIIFSFAIFLCLIPPALRASVLRVQDLGYGWLVPDEYVDIQNNPAMITRLTRSLLGVSLGNGSSNNTNDYSWFTTPGLDLFWKFDTFNLGLTSSTPVNYTNSDHTTAGENAGVTGGFALNDTQSLGARIFIDIDDMLHQPGSYEGLSLGFDNNNGNIDLGINLSGAIWFSSYTGNSYWGDLYAGLTCQDNFLANLRWFFLSLPFCNMGPCCRQLTA